MQKVIKLLCGVFKKERFDARDCIHVISISSRSEITNNALYKIKILMILESYFLHVASVFLVEHSYVILLHYIAKYLKRIVFRWIILSAVFSCENGDFPTNQSRHGAISWLLSITQECEADEISTPKQFFFLWNKII